MPNLEKENLLEGKAMVVVMMIGIKIILPSGVCINSKSNGPGSASA